MDATLSQNNRGNKEKFHESTQQPKIVEGEAVIELPSFQYQC